MARLVMVYVGMVNNVRAYSAMDAEDEKIVNDQNTIVCETKGERAKRTTLQNRSIHKYCTLLAQAFEESGLDMQEVLSRAVPIKWTMEAVKEVIWKRIQGVMYPDKPSTTQLETTDVNEVYQVVSRHMSTEFNVDVPFPNRFGN